MSRAPRFLVEGLPASGRVRLAGDEGRHLVVVLRARPGDAVRVFDGRGREVACTVVEAGRDGALLEIGADVAAPRFARRVVLATAMPRGERMEWLVEKATEAGVGEILPLAAGRSARKDAGENARRRWARAAAEASKQCGRADVPQVAEPMTLARAIELTAGAPRAVATPGAAARLDEIAAACGRIAVFVGPEGGFEDAETAALAAAGASSFGLGATVLRIETAALLAVHLAVR